MQSTKQKKIDKDGKTNLAFHRYLVLKKAGATDHAFFYVPVTLLKITLKYPFKKKKKKKKKNEYYSKGSMFTAPRGGSCQKEEAEKKVL
jgi:hypothetical protein